MLSPDARLTLLDALRPEPGDELDAAVATTGALDLAAALVPPLALAGFARSAFGRREPIDAVAALEAVRRVNSRIDVFAQAGRLAVPAAADRLAFLEPMVHPVRQPSVGHVFNPKLWLVRYRGDSGCRYRLLCLTRDLTEEYGWDAVLRLDGVATPADRLANGPLATLIEALPELAMRPLPPERTSRIRGLADEVRAVEWERPAGVEEIFFHAFGVGDGEHHADFSGTRHLIVTPLCTDDGTAVVAPRSEDRTIVSGADQLDRLAPATLAGMESYVLDAAVGLLEPGGTVLGGLHANVYVVERAGRAHLFLGSANATEAAFHGNVELLVELIGPAATIGIDALLGPSPSLRDLLEEYETPGGAAPADNRDEEALLALAQRDFTLSARPGSAGFDLELRSEDGVDWAHGTRLTIELLTRPGDAFEPAAGAPVGHTYRGLAVTEVTPFLVLRVGDSATVVPARLISDPAGRHDEVLAEQIDTAETFLRFVAASVGRGSGPIDLLGVPGRSGSTDASWWNRSGLFELLVRGLADRPHAIADLDGLVVRLAATERGAGVLPAGFSSLWRTLIGALSRLGDGVTQKEAR